MREIASTALFAGPVWRSPFGNTSYQQEIPDVHSPPCAKESEIVYRTLHIQAARDAESGAAISANAGSPGIAGVACRVYVESSRDGEMERPEKLEHSWSSGRPDQQDSVSTRHRRF